MFRSGGAIGRLMNLVKLRKLVIFVGQDKNFVTMQPFAKKSAF